MRGRRPSAAIDAAEKFAGRQGYRWIRNPDEEMPFDGIAYRANDMIVVRVKTSRRSPGDYDMYEDFFREEYDILHSLPFPRYTQRELWVRYPWKRTLNRFRIMDDRFFELSMIDQERPVFNLIKSKIKSKSPVSPSRTGEGTPEDSTPK